jgi:polyhydroxybutyrate depolymerase
MSRLKIASLVVFVVALLSGCARQKFDATTITGPGNYYGSLVVDGLDRTYIVHIPLSYDENEPTSLLLALHGGGGSARKMMNLTDFNTLSDKEGFVVVYPQGVENHWNDGRTLQNYRTHRENIDDVAFISALIDYLITELNIDETCIYAAGISNGAMMSCRLGCELSHKIAAIAMVVGAMPEDLGEHCSPSEPISVLIMNGTEDPLIPWEGGEIRVGNQMLGTTCSVNDTVLYWVTHNSCSPTPVITWLPDTDPDDGTRVRKEAYGQGRDETEVILYAIEGGGHMWPGGPQYLSEEVIAKTCRDIIGSHVIWQFFSEHEKGS